MTASVLHELMQTWDNAALALPPRWPQTGHVDLTPHPANLTHSRLGMARAPYR